MQGKNSRQIDFFNHSKLGGEIPPPRKGAWHRPNFVENG